jgi:molybdopterin-guanine dinucleotide biosynthesis protein A
MGGGDKALIESRRCCILERVGRLRGACDPIILNANGDPAVCALRAAAVCRRPRISPTFRRHSGRLDWAAAHAPAAQWPRACRATAFPPHDLIARLHAARATQRPPSVRARWRHPSPGWRVDLRDDPRHALAVEGLRKMRSGPGTALRSPPGRTGRLTCFST